MKSVVNLALQLGVELPPPATETQLDSFESEVGFRLPQEVRSLYTICDGLILREGKLRILPLDEVRSQWIPGLRHHGIPQIRNYVPLVDNGDSDPFCVCCDGIMAGYVVHVFHDDAAQVKFRSLDSFFTALQRFVQQDKWDLHQLPSEMDDPQRTPQDVAAARSLLKQAEQLIGIERKETLRFGMWLLSKEQIEEIIPLLEDRDSFVSRDAEERLATFISPLAQRAIQNYRNSLRRFIEHCVQQLRKSGLDHIHVGYEQDSIRLDPGPVWLDMRAYYAMRREHPDIVSFVVERAQSLVGQKQESE